MAWTDALAGVHGLTDEDADRVSVGFRRMAANVEQWPAPATLLTYLPDKPRAYFHALPPPEMTPEESEADRQRRRDVIAREHDRLHQLRLKGAL